MTMRKLWASLLLILALVAPAVAQGISDHIKWSQTQQKVSDTEADIIFTAQIGKGWHLYGTNIADGGPTPTNSLSTRSRGGNS